MLSERLNDHYSYKRPPCAVYVVSAVYCVDCGARCSSHSVKCAQCGSNLPTPVLKNPLYQKVAPVRPKAAVFDLDGTIFDNFQRFKDARRAGLIDKDGKPVQKGRQSMGAAWKKRNKFLYTKKNLAKDTVIPGSKELISSLTNDGYIIVYLTARPREYYNEILGQLESNGFPLFRDNAERVMLITKPPGNMKAAAYKGDEVRKLRGEFDVRMVFDDDLDALAEISKYDVPGLYSSVSDHVKVNPKVRNNPFKLKDPDAGPYDVAQSGPMGDETYVEDDKIVTKESIGKLRFRCENGHGPFKHSQTIPLELGDPMYTGYGSRGCPICGTSRGDYSVVKKLGGNRERTKLGEPSGRKVTVENVQKKLGDFVTENPVKRGNDSKGGYYRWGKGKKYHYKTGSDRSRNIARKKAYGQAKAAYAGGYRKNPHKSDYRQAAGAIIMHNDQILLLRRSTKETSKHGMWELPGGKLEDGETPEQAAMIEAKEESGLDIEIKGKAGVHADHNKEKVYHAFLAEPKNVNQEVKLSEEHDKSLWISLDEAMLMSDDELSHHAKYFFEQMKKPTEVKTNPANPKKVEKGKKLYKHMNGQDPEKVKVEKIDIGDVWYKVGEGGCWQIGYISGKDDGRDDQKYIHTFNEETQDGNFPELYATMPEKGKPMLIIKGGTWKIRTDDKGVAWIYD